MTLVMQALSIAGAVMILAAYFLLQRGKWSRDGTAYLWFNILGGAAMTAVATWDRRIGFIALEGCWALVSLWALVSRPRRRNAAAEPL